MMLAGSRRKGVTVLRKVAGRSAAADHQSLLLSPFENLLVPEWTRISSSSSSSSLSSQQRYIVSSSSQSSSVTIISDERDPFVSQNPAYWQQQTRVFHESPPSRQLKLKVPVKKGIKIRAKSSSSAFPSALDFATTSASTINNRNNPNPTTIIPKRISSRRQRLEAVRALPAAAELDLDWENDDYDTTTNQEEDSNAVVAASRISTVEACYVAKHIDLAQCVMNEFSKVSALSKGATARKFRAESLLLEFPPPTSPSSASADAITSNSNNADDETAAAAAASETPPMPSYVAVYRFGSVIFFNVSPRQRDQVIKIVKKYATEALVAGFEQRDSYGVCVRPDAPKTRVTPEYCIVQKLDMNAVAVISEVMAQSVALDAYNDIVDSLLDNFAILNSKISTTSTVDLDKQVLFSKIAQNNRIFIDLISKLRIKARSQIAWDKGEYEVIHAGMTGEFEIDDRFELIQFKLDLIQQNSKLFLEVIHHQKSASVEWVIVWLISFECVLMCLDMSGQGTVMFEFAKNIIG